MKLTFKGKKIEVEVDYSGSAVDAFVVDGYYVDTAEDLTEDELDELNEEATEYLAEYCMENSGYWRD